MNETLKTLVAAVIEDGKVDADEVAKIREEIFADGKVDRDECDALFEINDACSDNPDNDPGWKQLFADGVESYVLSDETTPGAIDEDEAKYLTEKLMADGQVDDTEKFVLQQIKAKATSIDEPFLKAMERIGI